MRPAFRNATDCGPFDAEIEPMRSEPTPHSSAQRPRRLPGESARQRFWRNHASRFLGAFCLAVGYMCATLTAWLDHLLGAGLQLRWLLMIPTVGLGGWAAWEYARLRKDGRNWLRGASGEVLVADLLQDLRKDGYVALHDFTVQGLGNIDHVLIGPGGVLAIETKYWTKRRSQDKVVYDGRTLTVGGFLPTRDPIEQAKRGARWVRNRIRESTTFDVPVRPVVLFPAWWVDAPKGGDVWVLNPKQMFALVRALPTTLNKDQVATIDRALELEAQWGNGR